MTADDERDGLTASGRRQVRALVALAMVGVAAVVLYLLHRETFSPKWSAPPRTGGGRC